MSNSIQSSTRRRGEKRNRRKADEKGEKGKFENHFLTVLRRSSY